MVVAALRLLLATAAVGGAADRNCCCCWWRHWQLPPTDALLPVLLPTETAIAAGDVKSDK